MERLTYGEFITNKIADIPYDQAFQTDVIAEAMAVLHYIKQSEV